MHPKFDIEKHSDDIALIRLDKPVPDSMFLFKFARTIRLPQAKNLALRNTFTVAGWGNSKIGILSVTVAVGSSFAFQTAPKRISKLKWTDTRDRVLRITFARSPDHRGRVRGAKTLRLWEACRFQVLLSE